jgi:transposase
MRPKGSAAELERRRRRAVQLLDAGERPSVVARILDVTRSSLARWQRLARSPDGLAAKPALGPQPRLSDEQLTALTLLLHQGAVAHGWPNHLWTAKRVAPRGQTPLLVCSDAHDRISVISAITLSPRELRVGLHFMLLGKNKNFHGEEVVLFLRQLKGEVGGPWAIVWDRNQIHSKALVVRAWLAKHPEVVVEDFPAHAPQSNPDEEVWSWTKYADLCNLAPMDVEELRQHIWESLTALKQQPQLLVSFILHARVPLHWEG